jgi:hypothetical protein
MQVTALGALAILIAPYMAMKRPLYLFFAAIFFAPFSGTAVLNIEAMSFGLSMAHFLFAAYGVGLLLGPNRAGVRLALAPGQIPPILALLLFLATLLASLWQPAVDGTLPGVSVNMLIYITFQVFVTIVTAVTLRRRDLFDKALQVYALSALFVSGWGIFQLACALTGIPYPDWLFNTSVSDSALLFGAGTAGGLVRVGSVAVEPSILVQSLSYFAAIACTLTARGAPLPGPWGRAALAATIVCMVLSTSTTGYVGLAALGVLLVIQSAPRATAGLVVFAIACVVLVLAQPGLVDAMLDSTVNKANSWSFDKRTSSMEYGLHAFLERPFLGWGWASITAASLPVFLLSGTGIIGAGAFVFLLATLCAPLLASAAGWGPDRRAGKKEPTGGDLAAGFLNALVIAMVMQTVAGFSYVFIDLWIFMGVVIGFAAAPDLAESTAAENFTRIGCTRIGE